MNQKICIALVTLISVMIMGVSYFNCKAEDGPIPGDDFIKEHSQVVGCGGVHPRFWKAGCCEGYGGCTNECFGYLPICDL